MRTLLIVVAFMLVGFTANAQKEISTKKTNKANSATITPTKTINSVQATQNHDKEKITTNERKIQSNVQKKVPNNSPKNEGLKAVSVKTKNNNGVNSTKNTNSTGSDSGVSEQEYLKNKIDSKYKIKDKALIEKRDKEKAEKTKNQ